MRFHICGIAAFLCIVVRADSFGCQSKIVGDGAVNVKSHPRATRPPVAGWPTSTAMPIKLADGPSKLIKLLFHHQKKQQQQQQHVPPPLPPHHHLHHENGVGLYVPYTGEFYPADHGYFIPHEMCPTHAPMCLHSEFGKKRVSGYI